MDDEWVRQGKAKQVIAATCLCEGSGGIRGEIQGIGTVIEHSIAP